MKYLDEMQEGGYPYDDVAIAFLQSMFNDRDYFLKSIIGENTIVQGVEFNNQNNTYSDGLITVAGKMYHFVGGEIQSSITKKVIKTNRQYEDGFQKKAFINEFYEFGNDGTDTIDFSVLEIIPNLKELILAKTSEMSDDNLEKIFTLKTLLSRLPTDAKRAMVRFATNSEISAGGKTDVAVSPKNLKDSDGFIMSGTISSSGQKLTNWKKDFTSSRVSTGRYLITHNIGNTNYGVVGSGILSGTVHVGVEIRNANSCEVIVNDDASPNDENFSFQIFRTA